MSKDLRSYNFTDSELIPAANINPSGSNAATGLPANFIRPYIRKINTATSLGKFSQSKFHIRSELRKYILRVMDFALVWFIKSRA